VNVAKEFARLTGEKWEPKNYKHITVPEALAEGRFKISRGFRVFLQNLPPRLRHNHHLAPREPGVIKFNQLPTAKK